MGLEVTWYKDAAIVEASLPLTFSLKHSFRFRCSTILCRASVFHFLSVLVYRAVVLIAVLEYFLISLSSSALRSRSLPGARLAAAAQLATHMPPNTAEVTSVQPRTSKICHIGFSRKLSGAPLPPVRQN